MAGISLQGVSKRYGAHQVIEALDLHIPEGEFTVFVGPSGCGKSTLLRMIAGLEDISDGTLCIGDKVMNHVAASKRGVAMVFQSYALYPHMSVAENMGFGLRMKKMPRAEISKRVAAVASTLQLDRLLDRRPAQLSGGQRQRVAIGRAMLREPEVFLFDEPLSNLDAELRVTMRVEIARLHRVLGTTMVYVTHDQTEAMTLADRIVVLRDGKIEQIGTPLELYGDPTTQFVAGFIGSPRMNFLDTRVSEGDCALRIGDTILPLPLKRDRPEAGSAVTVGIRPEHLRLACPASAPMGDSALPLSVEAIERLGSTNFVYGRTDGGATVVLENRDSARPVSEGDRVHAHLQALDMRLFAPDGTRLR
jgi:lactose/L-arabinose transport system ATP-binding protein